MPLSDSSSTINADELRAYQGRLCKLMLEHQDRLSKERSAARAATDDAASSDEADDSSVTSSERSKSITETRPQHDKSVLYD